MWRVDESLCGGMELEDHKKEEPFVHAAVSGFQRMGKRSEFLVGMVKEECTRGKRAHKARFLYFTPLLLSLGCLCQPGKSASSCESPLCHETQIRGHI